MRKLLSVLAILLLASTAQAGELTNYGATEALGGVNDTTSYLGLYSVCPTETGGGTELSGNGYARQAMTLSTASNGATSTSADITFTASGGDWSTVVCYGVSDASTSGNMTWFGNMDADQTVLDGQTLTISSGNLTLSVD